MKIVVYNTQNDFTEVTTKELKTYEDFKEILGELVLGKYKSPFYQPCLELWITKMSIKLISD